MLALPFLLLPLFDLIAKATAAECLRIIYLEKAPELYGMYRLLPSLTAYAYALDKVRDSHVLHADKSYLYFIGRRPVYSWLLEPKSFFSEIFGEPRGAVFVYGDVYPPSVRTFVQRLE